jgi:hypothetical protein
VGIVMKNSTAASENLRVTERTLEPGAHTHKRGNGKPADSTVQLAPRIPQNLVFTVDQWLARDLPQPDFLLGDLLSTTTRALFVAPTGTGKTMLMMGMGFGVAAGTMHWRDVRPAPVLMIDGDPHKAAHRRRSAAVRWSSGRLPCPQSRGHRELCTTQYPGRPKGDRPRDR